MEFVRGLHNICPKEFGSVVTIGNFDGCHLGHKRIIEKLVEVANRRKVPACVVTFEPHPREVFSHSEPKRIMSLRDKLHILQDWGVDRVICLTFNQNLMQISAEHFIQSFLVQKLGIKSIIVGDDFSFGFKRLGNISLLKQVANQYDYSVHVVPGISIKGARISSTEIRVRLEKGRFDAVQDLLGRPFELSGRVVKGFQAGRALGFPTANLNINPEKVPICGVFVVQVQRRGGAPMHWGVANIGTRPTLLEKAQVVVEIHLLDFSCDIYGEWLTATFLHKLRNEKRFESKNALVQQIERDVSETRVLQQSVAEIG